MKGNDSARRGLRLPPSERRGRHAAKSRLSRVLAVFSAVSLAGGLMLALAPAASAETTTAHVKQSTITDTANDNGCTATTWAGVHFVMTQLASDYPPSIQVILTDGTTDTPVTANLWKVTGKTAHYNYWFTSATDSLHVKDATAVVPAGWDGQFNISHCWPGSEDDTPDNPVVTLSKVWVNANAGDAVALSIVGTGVLGHTDGSSVAGGTGGEDATATVTPGASVSLSEDFTTGESDAYSTTLECKVDSGSYQAVTLNGLVGAYTVPSDATEVDCRFTNTGESENPSTTVTVTKHWVIDGAEYTVPQGDGHALPAGFSADLTLTGTDLGDDSPPAWGQTYTVTDVEGFAYDEADVEYPAGCFPAEQNATYLATSGLTVGTNNEFVVTNVVNCTTLTLKKVVDQGSATSWILTAAQQQSDAGTTISGRTGDPMVTNAFVPAGSYLLSESGPSNYKRTGLACTVDNGEGESAPAVPAADVVAIEQGQHVTCTFTNEHIPGGGTTTTTTTTTTTPTPEIVVQPTTEVETTAPVIVVEGVSQELPPAPVIAVKPAAQVEAAPSANAHTGEGQNPWMYLLFGAGALLMLGAWRARRHGNA